MARWVGIDIDATTVRVAQLQSGYRRGVVEAMREERVADHDSVQSAIRAATSGLRIDSLAVAIAGNRSFFRRIELPAAAQKELQSVLSFEVESTLPFELEDAVMDHRLLKPIAGVDTPGALPILSGVAYTEEVRDRIGLTQRATGTEPLRVGLGPLPLANLAQICPALRSAEPVALLDLGEHHADVVVLQSGEPRFARCLSRGTMGLPATAAALARELRQTLGAWRAQGGAGLDGVYVVGPGLETPGLESFFESELGVRALGLPDVALDAAPDDRGRVARFAKAIGLALSLSRRPLDLNMRQGPLETQQSYQFLRDKTPLLAGLFAAVAVSFGFSLVAESRALEREREMLEERLAAATKAHFGEETREPDAAAKLLDDAIGGKDDDPIPPIDGFGVMVELSERLPPDLVHDVAELDYVRGKVSLKGIVPTIEDANDVATRLAQHECFKGIGSPRTTQIKNEDKQKYTLDFEVRCGPDKDKKKKPAPAKSEGKVEP